MELGAIDGNRTAFSKYYVSDLSESVFRPENVRGRANCQPITVIDAFRETVKANPSSLALISSLPEDVITGSPSGPWRMYTWREYWFDCNLFAIAMIALGAEKFDVINILGTNSPQWFISNMGSMLAGCIPVGIYPNSSSEACCYVAQHSGASILLVENKSQLMKYKALPSDHLTSHLRAIVIWGDDTDISGTSTTTVDPLLSTWFPVPIYLWDELLDIGRQNFSQFDAVINHRLESVTPYHCASLVYTSGTTGPPKAVMLSHDNITWTAQQTFLKYGCGCAYTPADRILSYLPLSHIAAQMSDIYCPLLSGACTHFCSASAHRSKPTSSPSTGDKGGNISSSNSSSGSSAPKRSSSEYLVDCLRNVKPTLFFGVPHTWERLRSMIIESQCDSQNFLQKTAFRLARLVGAERSERCQYDGNHGPPCGSYLADKFVLSKVRAFLGLGDARALFSTGAPVSTDTLHFFASLGMPIYEIYGQTECTGPHSVSTPDQWKIGLCGRPLPGTMSKISTQSNEFCVRGRHVFMGYLHAPEATASAFTTSGYFKTGDTAETDEDGFLRITGRLKELIITSGGENVPYLRLEENVRAMLPEVSHCVVVGDQRHYLTALLTLKEEPLGAQTDLNTDTYPEVSAATVSGTKLQSPSLPLLSTGSVGGGGVQSSSSLHWAASAAASTLTSIKEGEQKKEEVSSSTFSKYTPATTTYQHHDITTTSCGPDSGDADGENHLLSNEVLLISKQIGSKARTASDAAADPLWRKRIDKGILAVNRKAASRAQYIQKWRLLPRDFAERSGELTALQKVKRSVVLEKYADVVGAMYVVEEEKEAL